MHQLGPYLNPYLNCVAEVRLDEPIGGSIGA